MSHSARNLFFISLPLVLFILSCQKSSPVAVKPPPVTGPTELQFGGSSWSGRDDNGKDWTYIFNDSAIAIDSAFAVDTTAEVFSGTFSLDTTSSPKKMDIHILKSSRPQAVGKTILTLFLHVQHDNVMSIKYNDPGVARPADMSTSLESPDISLFQN